MLATRLRDAPFAAAQKDIVGVSFYLPTAVLTVFRSQADGVATLSFVSRCLENLVQSEDDDKSGYEIIKDTAGVFFLGASAFVLRFDFFFKKSPSWVRLYKCCYIYDNPGTIAIP